ncbi:MAG: hypothetical protein SVX43_05880 [Cyanobacteriota bacterium]|nr:hypothetical protein [Cyanobacteriota bacterium]
MASSPRGWLYYIELAPMTVLGRYNNFTISENRSGLGMGNSRTKAIARLTCDRFRLSQILKPSAG